MWFSQKIIVVHMLCSDSQLLTVYLLSYLPQFVMVSNLVHTKVLDSYNSIFCQIYLIAKTFICFYNMEETSCTSMHEN
jgi:hypothetical protein